MADESVAASRGEGEHEAESSPATILRQLHRWHTNRTRARENIQRAHRLIQLRRQLISEKQQELDTTKQRLQELRRQIHLKEVDQKAKEERIAELTRRLNECKTNREYALLLSERKAQEAAAGRLEDELLELLMREDELKGKLEELRRELEKVRQEVAEFEEQTERKVSEYEQRLEEAERELARVEALLPPTPRELRETYQRLVRSKGADAIATVEEREGLTFVCLGCYSTLPPQLGMRLHADEWVLCSSCGRLLYLEQQEQQAHPPVE